MKKYVAVVIVLVMVMALAAGVTGNISTAQSEGQDAEIAAKLDEVLKGISQIKEELKIIKIRVTQIQ